MNAFNPSITVTPCVLHYLPLAPAHRTPLCTQHYFPLPRPPQYSALQTTNSNPNTIHSGSVLSCFLPLLGSYLVTSGSSSGKYHFFSFLMRESYPSKWYNFIVWAARHLKESREELRLTSSLWAKLSQTIVCNLLCQNADPKLYILEISRSLILLSWSDLSKSPPSNLGSVKYSVNHWWLLVLKIEPWRAF